MGIYSKLNRPIIIAEYDQEWPLLFEQERKRIQAVFGNGSIRIEHIGGTAVPGLAAKAVIDIAIGIQSLKMTSKYIPMVEDLEYTYEPTFEALLPERRFFWKGTFTVHTYHIHMAKVGSPLWLKPIMVRNYLRKHTEEAQHYSELKKSLAERYVKDMDAYVDGKTVFIKGVLVKAAQLPLYFSC